MAKKIAGYIKLEIKAGEAESVSAGRTCAGSARTQYYGILQGV